MKNNTHQRFELGTITIRPMAQQHVHPNDLLRALLRHARGDWGECCPQDRAANDVVRDDDSPLCSLYHDRNGTRFWILTEADRASTTVLLRDEY